MVPLSISDAFAVATLEGALHENHDRGAAAILPDGTALTVTASTRARVYVLLEKAGSPSRFDSFWPPEALFVAAGRSSENLQDRGSRLFGLRGLNSYSIRQ